MGALDSAPLADSYVTGCRYLVGGVWPYVEELA